MKTISHVMRCVTVASIAYGAAAPLQAAEPALQTTTRSIVVRYDDLDLSRQAGIDTLYQRLTAAAEDACAPRPDMLNFAEGREWQQCVKTATDNAVAGIANPMLSQTYRARSSPSAAKAGRPIA